MSRKDSSLSFSFRLTPSGPDSGFASAATRETTSGLVRRALACAGAQADRGKQPWRDRVPTGAFCPHRRAQKRVLIDSYGIDLRV
jgi:hypothetical protein